MKIRPATLDDVGLLVGWHGQSDVARYCDDEAYTREELDGALS
jgi:hypothetical protein